MHTTTELHPEQRRVLFDRWLREERFTAGETFTDYLARVIEAGDAERVSPAVPRRVDDEPWLDAEQRRADLHG